MEDMSSGISGLLSFEEGLPNIISCEWWLVKYCKFAKLQQTTRKQ